MRLTIDVNVWVAHLMATQHRRSGTAAQAIVAIAGGMQLSGRPVQIVVSLEMLDTLERVLIRLGFSAAAAADFGSALVELMKTGPEALDPDLLLSGRDQLDIHDREDAGVLATAIAGRVDLLVTDNLADFETKDSERIETQVVTSGGRERQLFALIHERQNGVSLLVAHPFDVLDWIARGIDLSAAAVRTAAATHRP
ncbi:PIN domain-containing protein [Labrys wisconsinensis]|uniref:Nucleic acid-binding protein n=1 Tax=Labrys wisconsinensis TaxID=425677 RepID=A0ABU0JHQ2_9HYPH|nr:PIN domain-containing protein [Labrys wisconsinensis]MDQ0473815.1 putative nucleic acid-binding protein [Labrys wisconsinensis]